MMEPRLWLCNHLGEVYTVSAAEFSLKRLEEGFNGGVIHLAACDWCAWAMGRDYRIYVFVLGTDIPIRVSQTTFENQRWVPFAGFHSSYLLPTDRCAWSDEPGWIFLPKDRLFLFSSNWKWEGNWFIDENLHGDICSDKGGWQYAVNFTSRWESQRKWNSCVRRRKWTRVCRFTSTDTWAQVSDSGLLDDDKCFIDMHVGGQNLPGQSPDFLSAWAVSVAGRVYFRTGVCRAYPEGYEWKHIPCEHMDIINIACGPTGLVWAIALDGHALVRTHISRDAICGLHWEVVLCYDESSHLMQVSVGRNAVWALSRDGRVWFWQGVSGDKLLWDSTAATGTSWIPMFGEMTHIAVSPSDQVFALSLHDGGKVIWVRTGITPSELGGKTWQRLAPFENHELLHQICAKHEISHSCSVCPDTFADAFLTATDQLPYNIQPSLTLSDTIMENTNLTNSNACMGNETVEEVFCENRSWQLVDNELFADVYFSKEEAFRQSSLRNVEKSDAVVPWISLGASEFFSGQQPRHDRKGQPLDRVATPLVKLSEAQRHCTWVWVAAGGFDIESLHTIPQIFMPKATHIKPISGCSFSIKKVYKEGILWSLQKRNQSEVQRFSNIEHAIGMIRWMKRGTVMLQWPIQNGCFYLCSYELELNREEEKSDILTLQFESKIGPMVIHLDLKSLRCAMLTDDHTLALYANKSHDSFSPFVLSAKSGEAIRELMGTINMANLSLWHLNQPMNTASVCSVTELGGVFFGHPSVTNDITDQNLMWGQHGGHMTVVEMSASGVVWAIGSDRSAWVYNGGYGNELSREMLEVSCSLKKQVDYQVVHVFEYERWFPVIGYHRRGMRKHFNWATAEGEFIVSPKQIKLPSFQWQWVSEWTVDFSTGGGVDNSGWQYSSNFYSGFHAHQRLHDYVRRRRWSRRCKLVTYGPWINVGPPELVDISIQLNAPDFLDQPIVLWAVASNGNIFCRHSVTVTEPMGKKWISVMAQSDMSFRSVSVGGGNRVWAVAADGSVWYRTGVSPTTPTGSIWIQVIPPPPGGALLHYVSVGESAVWAVDTQHNLFRREEITSFFPEGTRWSFVCNHVRKVSVGPRDQVWVVSNVNFGRPKQPDGFLYRRLGVTKSTLSGTGWEMVFERGLQHVSARGRATTV